MILRQAFKLTAITQQHLEEAATSSHPRETSLNGPITLKKKNTLTLVCGVDVWLPCIKWHMPWLWQTQAMAASLQGLFCDFCIWWGPELEQQSSIRLFHHTWGTSSLIWTQGHLCRPWPQPSCFCTSLSQTAQIPGWLWLLLQHYTCHRPQQAQPPSGSIFHTCPLLLKVSHPNIRANHITVYSPWKIIQDCSPNHHGGTLLCPPLRIGWQHLHGHYQLRYGHC